MGNKCPMYNCGSEKNFLLKFRNPNKFDSSNITITLNKVCNSTQGCQADLTEIYNKEKVQTKCINISSEKGKYAGEKCSKNTDCANKNCTSSNVCNFVDDMAKGCEQNNLAKMCGIGHYCNSTNICDKQKEKDQACGSTFDCSNHLVCYNKTCSMEYVKVKDGESIKTELLGDFNYFDLLCETTKFDTKTKKCYSYDYKNQTSMMANVDGFVACTTTSAKNECQYDTSLNTTMTKSCECGYNSLGQGYCPIDYENGKKKFDGVANTFDSSLSGKCNSYNRYNCDVDSQSYKSFVNANEELNTAHLYYDSVSCARDVLSGKFINFSLISLMMYALLF